MKASAIARDFVTTRVSFRGGVAAVTLAADDLVNQIDRLRGILGPRIAGKF
jgi:hypothetical protein